MNLKDKIKYSILSSAVGDMVEINDLCSRSQETFKRVFGEKYVVSPDDFLKMINDFIEWGYIEKLSIFNDNSILKQESNEVFLTESGKAEYTAAKVQLTKEAEALLREGSREGVVKIAEKIVRSNQVILAVFAKNATAVSMMLSASKENKEERIFLNIPYLGEESEYYTGYLKEVFEIVDPDPTFMCINAFAIFLNVQGVEVYFPKVEKETTYEYIEQNYSSEIKTETYDTSNPPTSFCVFNQKQMERVIKSVLMEN
jgi:hypothetical protein